MPVLPQILKTQGIVLKTIPYGEKGCITRVFTRDYGVIPCLIKNTRRKDGKHKLSYFKELTILMLDLSKYKNSDFYRIDDLQICYLYAFQISFYQDLNKVCIFMFLAEVIEKCTKEDVYSPELYDFIYSSLMEMDNCEKISFDFHLIFMIQLTRLFGLAMNFDNYSETAVFNIAEGTFTEKAPSQELCIPAKYALLMKDAFSLQLNDRLPGSNTEIRRNLITYLQYFYRYHFPNFKDLKSVHVLKQIIEAE